MAPEQMILVFILGIFAQSALFLFDAGILTGSPDQWLARVGGALASGLFGLAPGRRERNYSLYFHLCVGAVIYISIFLSFFKKEILSRVSESSLLCNCLVFWYLFATTFRDTLDQKLLLGIAALPTLGTLAIAFSIRSWNFGVKFACYVWFLFLIAAIAVLQVRVGNLDFLFGKTPDDGPFGVFLTGMAAAYMWAGLYYLFILVPIPGKRQTFAERMDVWRADASMMAGRFSDYALTPQQAGTVIALQGGLYGLNLQFHLVSDAVLLNASLVFLPYVYRALAGPPAGAAVCVPNPSAGA